MELVATRWININNNNAIEQRKRPMQRNNARKQCKGTMQKSNAKEESQS